MSYTVFTWLFNCFCITVDNNHLSALSRKERERIRKKINKRKEIEEEKL